MKTRALALIAPAAILCATLAVQAAQQGGGGEAPQPQGPVYDVAAVPAGTYVVDPQHAALTGQLRHAGLSHFVFRFKRFDARFTYDPAKPETPSIQVTIDPSSIDTNVAGFDTNLATSDRHFNVAKFPEIRFVSNSLKRTAPDKGVMAGNITFLGVTRPLAFDVAFQGVTRARGGARVAFLATTTLKRSDFHFADGSDNLADDVVVTVDADFVSTR
jgi:polyisoprenoid-binding protein YceI